MAKAAAQQKPAKPAGKKPRSAKEKGPPTRPHSGYIEFTIATRPSLQAKNPGLHMKEIAKKMGEMWKQLSDEEKKEFSDRAQADFEAKGGPAAAAAAKAQKALDKQVAKDAKKAAKGKKAAPAPAAAAPSEEDTEEHSMDDDAEEED